MSTRQSGSRLRFLGLLAAQNTAVSLVLEQAGLAGTYSTLTVMTLTEGLKWGLSAFFLLRHRLRSSHLAYHHVNTSVIPSLIMFPPALLFFVQTQCLMEASKLVDQSTYIILSQSKILTTALFSVILLNKTLNGYQWIALILLATGVAFTQVFADDTKILATPLGLTAFGLANVPSWNESFSLIKFSSSGWGLLLFASLVSGIANTYIERAFKFEEKGQDTSRSLWSRNFELSSWSLLFCFLSMVFSYILTKPIHFSVQGFTIWTWLVVLLQATGGILVAAVVKNADNIMKSFATSSSVVASALISRFIYNRPVSVGVAWSMGLVIFSILLFAYSSKSSPKPDKKKVE